MLTGAEIKLAFDEEAGDAASLAGDAEKWRWFSEGLSRLLQHQPKSAAINWVLGATDLPLPADFIQVNKIDYPSGVAVQDWRVFGRNLVIDKRSGATSVGNAQLYYWGEFAAIDDAGDVSGATKQMDYACLYYALHRFFRKLASNRVQYKRYATLLGANAVSVADLQAESDRLLQDFIDARGDLPPLTPTSFYVN